MSDQESGVREERRDVKHATSAHTLALAASVAMLGVSLGVNVQDLLAASPTETVQSDQSKGSRDIPHYTIKRQALQQKLGAGQFKEEALQNKLDTQQRKQGAPSGKPDAQHIKQDASSGKMVDPMAPGAR